MTLQTVERALTFLETVANSASPLTIKDVAGAMGLNITTCYHLFNTLHARGYVDRKPDSTLAIGFEVAVLYDGYRRGAPESVRIGEAVSVLARETGETAWFARVVGDRVVLTAFEEGSQPVRASGLVVGLSGDEHRRASGRAVLAYLDESRRLAMLEASLAGADDDERSEVDKKLRLVRELGFDVDDEQYQVGIFAVAAPFFNENGEVLGSIGIWAPAERGRARFDALRDRVIAAGERATAVFGR